MKKVGDKQAFKHRITKEIVKIVGRIIVKLDGSDTLNGNLLPHPFPAV